MPDLSWLISRFPVEPKENTFMKPENSWLRRAEVAEDDGGGLLVSWLYIAKVAAFY